MFELRFVVQNWGIFAGFGMMAILGFFAGIIGHILNKKEKKVKDGWREQIFVVAFSLILLSFWMCLVGYFLASWYGTGSGSFLAALAIMEIFLYFGALGCFYDKTGFSAKNTENRINIFLLMVSPMVIISMTSAEPVSLFNTNKEQEASYISQQITIGPKEGIADYIPSKVNDVNPFYVAVGDLRAGNVAEGVKLIDQVATNKDETAKNKLWGFRSYYQADYESAYRYFSIAGSNELAIIALYRAGKLDRPTFNKLEKNISSITYLLQKINETLPIEKKSISSSDKLDAILQRLAVIEKKMKNETIKITEKELNQTVFEKLLAFQKAPSNFRLTPVINFLFLVSSWMLFILCMFSANMFLQDFHAINNGRILKFLSSKYEKTTSLLSRISWHSFIARKISAKIAISEKEKGMFSQEIEKIQQAVFPLDAILSLFYLRKTKKILKNWELNSQEKEDIKTIYQEFKKLAGRLIPQGNEESLLVITALRKKASQITNTCLKNDIDYQQGRISLLATFDELATVGDILEARKTENQISYYSLLGIKTSAETEEIKKGYRSVISAIHPDHHQGNLHLQSLATMVNVAYSTLTNSVYKEVYDKQMGF